jgi:hypothetical protein
MSNMKNTYLDVSEALSVSPAQLLRDITTEGDLELQEHLRDHNGHPSANCRYCVEKADEPVEQELEEEYA